MVISKPVIGTLDIDLDRGVIWLNDVVCVLRICKLDFVNKLDKFTSVDITAGKIVMENNPIEGNLYQERLHQIFMKAYSKTMSHENPTEFLNRLERVLEVF